MGKQDRYTLYVRDVSKALDYSLNTVRTVSQLLGLEKLGLVIRNKRNERLFSPEAITYIRENYGAARSDAKSMAAYLGITPNQLYYLMKKMEKDGVNMSRFHLASRPNHGRQRFVFPQGTAEYLRGILDSTRLIHHDRMTSPWEQPKARARRLEQRYDRSKKKLLFTRGSRRRRKSR